MKPAPRTRFRRWRALAVFLLLTTAPALAQSPPVLRQQDDAYTYDAAGRLTAAASEAFSLAFGYDAAGSLLAVSVASFVTVWPGDTNDDGTADQVDVLPLGLFFGQTGPARAGASLAWQGQPAVPWAAPAATHADANGDGTVDQVDVLPIGLNFGKTHGAAKQAASGVLATLAIPPLPAGTCFPVHVEPTAGPGGARVLGLAFELDVSAGLAVTAVAPAGALDDGSLLRFERFVDETGRLHVAFTRTRGPVAALPPGGALASVTLEVTAPMSGPATLTLHQAAVGTPDGLQAGGLGLSSPAATLPTAYALEAAYPNPFNPQTVIAYALPEPAEVKLAVYDALGRAVAVLVDGPQEAGRHKVAFDGSGLASGTYFYRLRAGRFVAVRPVILAR